MTQLVWVKGVAGRLTRTERGQPFLSVTDWKKVELTRRIQIKAERGSLLISTTDPDTKKNLEVEPPPGKVSDTKKEAKQ